MALLSRSVINLLFRNDFLKMGLMAPAFTGVWPWKRTEIHPGLLAKHPHCTPPQAAEGKHLAKAAAVAQASAHPSCSSDTLGSRASPRPPDPGRPRVSGLTAMLRLRRGRPESLGLSH